MSKKQDEQDALALIVGVVWIGCSLTFGWVVGTILAILTIIAFALEGSAKKSNKQSKSSYVKTSSKTTKTSKPTKSLFEMIEDDKKKAEEKKKQQLEKEMDNYGLSEEEKEIVRNSNGEYEPYQFDEEELEEDDYYSDDDVILSAFNNPNDKLP